MDNTNIRVKKLEKLVGVLFSQIASLKRTVDEQQVKIISLEGANRTSPLGETVGSQSLSKVPKKRKSRSKKSKKLEPKVQDVSYENKKITPNPVSEPEAVPKQVIANKRKQKARFYYGLRNRNKKLNNDITSIQNSKELSFLDSDSNILGGLMTGGYEKPKIPYARFGKIDFSSQKSIKAEERHTKLYEKASPRRICHDVSCSNDIRPLCGFYCEDHHVELCGKKLSGCVGYVK